LYKVKWDEKYNGVLLIDNSKKTDEVITPPRPVFFEELDLLGFDKFWKYPREKNPLLWAIGRRYYYKGVLVAKTEGGTILEPPKIILIEKKKKFALEPINIKKIVEKNQEPLFALENEAMDFIENTYKVYKHKVDFFTIAFSGGKDSQVILDLVTRIITPNELITIFSDTTMEISDTYRSVEKTRETYKQKYPGLKFYIAKPPRSAIEFWREFGPPSRIHRWCCTVTKTAPFVKLVNDISKKKTNKQSKILVFEGVRAEESEKRSNYQRIAKGIKHLNVINSRPIFYWNLTEVILYCFLRNLPINSGYRYGLTRVGCVICPFSSNWSEYILSRKQKKLEEYISLVRKYAVSMGLNGKGKIDEYIAHGQWKKRAGAKGFDNSGTTINFADNDKNKFKAVLQKPREDPLEWLKVVGRVFYKEALLNQKIGELKINNETFPFTLTCGNDKKIIEFNGIKKDVAILGKVKKALYKATYCVHCGSCEIECPTGALSVTPKVKINSRLCIHCGNCLNFVTNGCLVAKSAHNSYREGGSMKRKTSSIDKYSTFGMRESWMKSFLIRGNNWMNENNLGTKQLTAMLHWLSDAELINSKTKEITDLGISLKEIQLKNYLFVWHVIWNNLYYNSSVVRWYCDAVEWNSILEKKELKEKIKDCYPDLSEGTLSNPIDAMVNMFDNSPLGKITQIGIVEKKGRVIKKIKKFGTDDIHPLAVAYSLYKIAEHSERRNFTVSELYTRKFRGGPYKLFGISQKKLIKILRGLQEDKGQILRIGIVADLDNIDLRENLSSLDILEIMRSKAPQFI